MSILFLGINFTRLKLVANYGTSNILEFSIHKKISNYKNSHVLANLFKKFEQNIIIFSILNKNNNNQHRINICYKIY